MRSIPCTRCQAENREGRRFCAECGAPLPTPCAGCGFPNEPDEKFCGGCGIPLGTAAPAAHRKPGQPEAERRHLTVLFGDLVGSTELSGRLDPEDMGRVIRTYQTCCAAAIRRWEGYVARFMGDGVLAYFGFPRAHEDDAERGVRAGLELSDAVGHLTAAGGPLAARVGIATGLVMVRQRVGEEPADEETVFGETPNLAARLQAFAEPGSVVIAASTRRLVGNLFELTDLGPRRLKGFAEPLSVFRVEGEGLVQGRFEAFHPQRLTPLVGRELELASLLDHWTQAKKAEGQVVLLPGEPGIGKSRLIRALRQRLATEPHVAVSHFCSPHHVDSALHPIIGQLERAAAFAPNDPPEVKLGKLEALLGQATDELGEAVPLIGGLLGIAAGERYPRLNLNPQQQKRRTLEALVEQLAGLARTRPVLDIYEDVHWIDPSTLELLDVVVRRVRSLPVLLLISYRPEFQPPWGDQPHVTELPLNRLSRSNGRALVERVSGKGLPSEVLEQIVTRTDGVPLFIEELTKTVVESGLLNETDDRYELIGPLPPLAIPATLHDSLMARLDRLAPVKEVAQIAAVIGRDFSSRLLSAVALVNGEQLAAALDQLVASELVFRRGTPPAVTYSFKHALVQDAAYQSLLKSRRQQLHAKIIHVLEEQFRDVTLTQPEILARHCTAAQLTDRAIDYWLLAGKRASRRSDNAEAVAHLRRGLELLELAPETPAADEKKLRFLVELGPALIATRGAGTREVQATYRRALEIAKKVPESELHFVAHWGWWRIAHNMRVALQRADGLLELAQRTGNDELVLQAHHCQWATNFHLGNHSSCLEHIEEGFSLYDPDRFKHHASIYGGHDPKVCGLGERGLSLWLIGYPDRALESAEQALEWAQQIEHGGSILHAMDYALMLSRYRRDPARTLAMSNQMIRFARRNAFPEYVPKGQVFRGWAIAVVEDPARGLQEITGGIAEQVEMGTSEDLPVFFDMIAEIQGILGLHEDGLESVRRGRGVARSFSAHYWNAELLRRQADLLHKSGRATDRKCVSILRKAAEIAAQQGAHSLRLRLAVQALSLCGNEAMREAARSELASIFDSFDEGFDTPDLREAGALINQGSVL
jgi:class 3 adenylate cyclase/predicted ATPase